MAATYEISFTEGAAVELIMAALEAYEGRRRHEKAAVETYGHLWGYRRTGPEVTRFRVSHTSTSVLAKRGPDSVRPNAHTLCIKDEVMQRLAPDLSYLGDFHTHPYTSLSETNFHKGWKFSAPDFSSFEDDEETWRLADNEPLMLVATVCPISRVREAWAGWQTQHVLRLDIGEFRFWIGGAVGSISADGKKRMTGNDRSPVTMRSLPLELYNKRGDRFRQAE